jgi:hypothetical protein
MGLCFFLTIASRMGGVNGLSQPFVSRGSHRTSISLLQFVRVGK